MGIESRYEDLSGNRGEVGFKKNRGFSCLELQRGQVILRKSRYKKYKN